MTNQSSTIRWIVGGVFKQFKQGQSKLYGLNTDSVTLAANSDMPSWLSVMWLKSNLKLWHHYIVKCSGRVKLASSAREKHYYAYSMDNVQEENQKLKGFSDVWARQGILWSVVCKGKEFSSYTFSAQLHFYTFSVITYWSLKSWDPHVLTGCTRFTLVTIN